MLQKTRAIVLVLLVTILAVVSKPLPAQALRNKGIVVFLILENIKNFRTLRTTSFSSSPKNSIEENSIPVFGRNAFIFVPKFERPKGAVFCRMEDAIEQRTKLFKVTVGVK